jgi:pimeloyl-ACP methyl ester carboxylesterase
MSHREAPRSEQMQLDTGTGVLYGTLSLPAADGRLPAVLIIAGSGPTDRDGNTPLITGRNDSLKLLAEGLEGYGIASLRYDKRGVAASRAAMEDESKLTFDSYVDDAVGWVRRLESDPRFSSVGVIGHSEGSLIGMVAARRAGAAAFVSVAGAGEPLDQTVLRQLQDRAPALVEDARRITAALRSGETVPLAEIPVDLQPLFRPNVQPFLISEFRYDPAAEIAKLEIPVLVIVGSHDLQSSLADARRLAGAQPSAQLRIVEGMNHVLKQSPADPQANFATYGDPSLPLDPTFLEAVGGFLRETLE